MKRIFVSSILILCLGPFLLIPPLAKADTWQPRFVIDSPIRDEFSCAPVKPGPGCECPPISTVTLPVDVTYPAFPITRDGDSISSVLGVYGPFGDFDVTDATCSLNGVTAGSVVDFTLELTGHVTNIILPELFDPLGSINVRYEVKEAAISGAKITGRFNSTVEVNTDPANCVDMRVAQIASGTVNVVIKEECKIDLGITKARMVSKNELGVDLTMTIPKADRKPWKVRFSGKINDQNFTTQEFDVSDLLEPGDTNKEIRFDDGTDDRKINLEEYGIPRFEKNQTFKLTAMITGGACRGTASEDVTILLPVIIIHGVTKNILEDMVKFVPYKGLQEFLVAHKYDVDDSWYKTLWGPPGVHFSSQEDTPEEVAKMLRGWIDKIQEMTYADRVNLIGHSLGGLVGRYYAWQDPERIHKVIMIGTPSKGSSVFYQIVFKKSKEWTLNKLQTSDKHWNLRRWLSPVYSSLYDSASGAEISNPFPDLLENLFHANGHDKPAPPGVEYYSIYNPSLQTPYEILVKPIAGGTWYKSKKVRLNGPGDGTVLAESAITDAENTPVATMTKHALLPSDAFIEAEVLNALEDGE